MIVFLRRHLPCLANLLLWVLGLFRSVDKKDYESVKADEFDSNLELSSDLQPSRDLLKDEDDEEMPSFTIDLPRDLPYRELLTEKATQLVEAVTRAPQSMQRVLLDEGPAQLQVYFRFVQEKESLAKINEFAWECVMPCGWQTFGRFQCDWQRQKEVNVKVKELEQLQELAPGLTLNYMEYKKYLTKSSRDFLFLRYEGAVALDGQPHRFVLMTSVKDDRYPESTRNVRGQVLLSGCLYREKDGRTYARYFNSMNIFLSVSPLMIKQPSIIDIKKTVYNAYKELETKK